MGVYVKGMKIPVTCCHCPLMGYDPDREWYDSMARTGAHICVLTGELIDNTKREEHCPLVPVPAHGDLIERDKLREKEFVHDGDAYAVVMSRDIRNAPTIIPADPAEENET